jgi:hypothetical protein
MAVSPGFDGEWLVLLAHEELKGLTIESLAGDHPARPFGYTGRIVTPGFDGDVKNDGLFRDNGVAEIVRDALGEQTG